MRKLAKILIISGLAARRVAAEFGNRFESPKVAAAPAQLYALLYDLPKGGDLHNHSGGSDRPEWIFAIGTDPARNGGDNFYTRASRIGHGVNLIKDPETLLLLQQTRRVLVEVNLISNRPVEFTPDLAKHPFPEYLRTGVPVCLNTDDRGMWDSNLADEYFTAVTLYRLSWEEVVQLGRNSLAYYKTRVAAFEAKFSQGSVADALAKLTAIKSVTYGYAKRTWGREFE